MLIYRKGAFGFCQRMTLTQNDPFAKQLSEVWNQGLVQALEGLPHFPWESRAPFTAGTKCEVAKIAGSPARTS